MSDINPGDVVVCVDAQPLPGFSWIEVRQGGHYRVSSVSQWREMPTVRLVAMPNAGGTGYLARRFRKIDRADDSFTEQVRKCRPIKTREPAPC